MYNVDNFYTSPQLFKDLLEAGTLTCGTIRSNRKGFPAGVKDNVDQNDSLFCKADMTEGFMTAVHWKDKRDVFALTTIHGNAVGDDIPYKPELISEYNKSNTWVVLTTMISCWFTLPLGEKL